MYHFYHERFDSLEYDWYLKPITIIIKIRFFSQKKQKNFRLHCMKRKKEVLVLDWGRHGHKTRVCTRGDERKGSE